MPDFEALVRFLVEPFLEAPQALRLDCEHLAEGKKLWIRIAFEGDDKGRVFGRGGRNIQAIRKVVKSTAQMVGQSVHLDVYGEPSHQEGGSSEHRSDSRRDGGGRPPRGGGGPRGRGGPRGDRPSGDRSRRR
jgi:uncharacterized protein